ncbi:MAG: class I SAM-dependent methyltransferase [Planctomycetaceae bacterium]|nr:class I SAM-dependent methyltransferase [Planctomycetales bacterium]MCB9924082.1 class I SAM-dependent methyltransferase [Planctomycetaceae bacterium]
MHPFNQPGIQWLRGSQWLTQKLVAWAEAIQSGIFMGLVDDSDFQAFDTYPFDETKPINVANEANFGLEPWEKQAIHEHLTQAQSVLVVAAGGARELLGLSELGYDATGIEYGRELCASSQRELSIRKSSAAIYDSERFQVPPGDRPYDAAFIARKFLSYIHNRDRRIEFLASIHRVIRPRAPLVFGYYTRDRDTLAFRLQAALANLLRKLRGRRDYPIEVGDHIDPHAPLYHHHYVWEELREELREAGFVPIEHQTSWFGWAVARSAITNEEPQLRRSGDWETNATNQELVETN